MARWKALVVAMASLAASAVVIAAAPAQDSKVSSKKPAVAGMESNEQIVADFLWRKERAEKAQRTIIQGYRKSLDQKRAEFEEARRKFDGARSRYVEIVGPLGKQGFMNPDDPRLPYEFDLKRPAPEASEGPSGNLSQRGAGADPR